MLTCDKYKFVLYTFAKSAGETMKHWFVCIQKDIDFNLLENSNYKDFSHKVPPIFFKRPHVKVSQLSDEYNENYFHFIVVRNPYSRLVSAWFDKISNSMIRAFYKENISFENWLEELFLIKNRQEMDNHWKPQYYIAEELDNIKICKVESLQEDMNDVCDILDIPKYKMHNRKETMRRYKKPFYEYYNDRTIEIVLDIYKKDFELLGYDEDINFYK